MTKTTAERVCKIVMDHLPNATVLTMLTPLDKLGIDSLDRWDMVIKIEEEFGIDIEQEAITAWNTVQDVIDTVDNLYRPHLTALDRAAEHQAEADVLQMRTVWPSDPAHIPAPPEVIAEFTATPDNVKYAPGDYSEADLIERAKIKIASSKTYGQINTPVINAITREDIHMFKGYTPKASEISGGNALDLYQSIATKSAIYPGQGTPLGLAYVALKLNGEAGEFAEHVGKAMRDDNYIGNLEVTNGEVVDAGGTLTPERRAAIIKEIGDVLWYASAACNELGITLSEAALTNLEKLCDRTERDALRGSGDDR